MLKFQHRDARLIANFFAMSLRDKYLGSSLGSLWGIANPLLMFVVFTFVFGFVFKARLPGADTTLGYAIWLISGYGPWIATTEGIMASATSVVSAAGIVKNVAFKTEILPISAALTGLLPLAVTFVFLLILLSIDGNFPTWHVVFVPMVAVLQFGLIIGAGLLLSAVTVFFRDLAYALPNLLLIVLFATPILYPVESMPGALQTASRLNPFYVTAEAYRSAMVFHRVPDLWSLGYVLLIAAAVLYVGLGLFRRVKGFFEAAL